MTNITWNLRRASKEQENKVALIDDDETKYTYGDLETVSNRIGNFLEERCDVREGDIVSGILPSSFWTIAFISGTMKIGAAFTTENHTLTHETIRGNLENAESVALIVDREVFTSADDLAEEVDPIEYLVSMRNGNVNLTEAVQEHSDELSITPRRNNDLAGLNYTSGTTGPPKAVQLTHGTLAANISASTNAIRGLHSYDVGLLSTPMFHIAGITAPLMSVSAQSTLHVMDGWEVDQFIDRITTYDINMFYWIAPTWARDLMDHDRWDDLDLNGLETYISGGPGQPHMFEGLRERGGRPSVIYGMTESMGDAVTCASIAKDEDKELNIGSVGTAAGELGEVKIVDIETGEEITEPDVEGEVCYRGDNLTPGYYNDPERTAEAFDEEGWFYTDDLGYYDDEDYLYISGRADDMIIAGEEKLSLTELDDVLLKHEMVDDAGTVGVDHERFGEVPAAFVVPKDASVTEEDLKEELDQYMRDQLARWKRPRLYAILDEIPRTTSKQSKIAPELEKHIEDVILSVEDGVNTLSSVH